MDADSRIVGLCSGYEVPTMRFHSGPPIRRRDGVPVVVAVALPKPTVVEVLAAKQAIHTVKDREQKRRELEADWKTWLTSMFPSFVQPPFAPYHVDFWHWLWAIQPNESTYPFVAIWPRGFAKSTSAEAACAAVAARDTRNYGLYICDTQDQADKHVSNVATLLESPRFSATYPQASSRRLGKFGASKGWRRNRLRTASGFTLDAIGLDTAARGAKVDEDRPDFLIFDDIDDVLDSPATVTKKITVITKSILHARAPHAATLVVQNLVHQDGIVAQLADGRADFLAHREVSGPHPALRNAAYEQRDGAWVIVDGEPTWPAMGILELQRDLNETGITAFRAEKQHEVDHIAGGIFGHLEFRHCAWKDLPDLERIVVWVDPAVTDTDQSDAHGIQADGIAADKTIYRLFSWEARTSPEDVLRRAILKAVELKAECVGIETNQGGDTWQSVYERVLERVQEAGELSAATILPEFREAKAGAGTGPKAHRANQMLVDYERGKVVHVLGTHETLERALRRYLLRKPYDLVDAAYWSWADLAQRADNDPVGW